MKNILLFISLTICFNNFGQYLEKNKLGLTDTDCIELLNGTFTAPGFDSINVIYINDNEWKESWDNGSLIFTAKITWLGGCEMRIDWNENRQNFFAGGLPVEYIEIDFVSKKIIGVKRTFIVLDTETREVIKIFEPKVEEFKRIQ